MKVKLSERLRMSADLIPQGSVIADVGCDHAHLCIYALQNGISERCIGMDVRTGPLGKAKANLELYGCTDRVELRLGDGLERLLPGEADVAVITGMGGELIRDILERAAVRGLKVPMLILQPQSYQSPVRGWLADNGYLIDAEDMCREDDKYYMTMRAVYVGSNTEYTEAELTYGPKLIAGHHPVLSEFLEVQRRKCIFRLERIARSTDPASEERKKFFEHELEIIEAVPKK